jgi:long-chain acyl-CoA synthetase
MQVSEPERRETVLDYLDRNAAEHGGNIAAVADGERVSWAEYRRRARAVALALRDLGVERGQVVGLHTVNRVEHALADMGVLTAGAVPASYYLTLAEEQLVHVARDSGAVLVVTDTERLPHWLAIRERLPRLRHLVVLDLDTAQPPPDGVLSYQECVAAAEDQLERRGGELDEVRATLGPTDSLTIVYTSGTTGPPKGTVITHQAAVWVLDEIDRQLEEHLGGPVPVGWTTVSYLPLAHVAERLFSHWQGLTRALTVHFVADMTRLPHVLATARPDLFLGVPRVWERMHAALRERATGSGGRARRALAARAFAVATRVGVARMGGAAVGPGTRAAHALFERLVYRRIRTGLGLDRAGLTVSGAAMLPEEVSAFFAGVGLVIVQVYGLTESCAVLAVSPPDAPRLGTVGRPLAGLELKVAEDGEVLARGPNITTGYLNRPEQTREAIDQAGWLHTGDIGALDDDGYLRITGRKKDLINTASGKTISPVLVEAELSRASDLVGSVYVHGDDRPCLVALVTLEPSRWSGWCREQGIAVDTPAEAVRHGRVRLEVARCIGAGNARLSRVEQVKNWALLPDLWEPGGEELTPTQKLRRSVVAERYGEEIEQLYDSGGTWDEDG